MEKAEEHHQELIIATHEMEDGRFIAEATLGFAVGCIGLTAEEAVQNLLARAEDLFKSMGIGMHAESLTNISTGKEFAPHKQERKVDA